MNTKQTKPALFTDTRFRQFATRTCCIFALVSTLFFGGTAHAEERPFKGRIDGQFVATPTSNPTIYVGGAQAVGNSTHVGAFTKVTSDVTDISTGAVEGSFTMTAANGDHVTGVYSGFLVFGGEPGTFSWVLDATITGGSGRFAGASGEFVFVAEGMLFVEGGIVRGNYTETFDGSITY